MQINYVRATKEDIDVLVATRVETLRAANLLNPATDMSLVEINSRQYYCKNLESVNHIAYLAYASNKVVACGGISFYTVMPTYHNPTGKKAYIMNMFTQPDYRRLGIANRLLDLLVGASKERCVFEITLEATAAGRPLYEKYGFIPLDNEMVLPIDRFPC